jgi:TolA-binding protein
VWLPEAAVEVGRIFLTEENWQETLRYGELARKASRVMVDPSTSLRTGVTLLMAHARRVQGEFTLAYPLYQEVRKRMPASAPGEEAKARIHDLRGSHPDLFGLTTDADYLHEGPLLHAETDRTGLEKIVSRYTEKFPAGRLHPEMLKVLAYAYRREGRIARALALLEDLTVRYPKSSAAPEALHTWGTILWNRDKDGEALKLFQQLVQWYPRHALAADSLYAIGRIHEKAGKDALAAEAYTKLTARFPQSPLAREGKWRQGWMAYRRGDFRQAWALFSQLVGPASGTLEGEGALYWQARSAEREGQRDKAIRLYQMLLQQYPNGYYALWAEKRLKAPLIPPSTSLRTGSSR